MTDFDDPDGAGASSRRRPETLAVQGLGWTDRQTGALTAALHPATTFERGPDLELVGGHAYARPDNPTVEQPEAMLAALEGGQDALLFASGMAAATAVFQSLDPGDHVLVGEGIYWGLRRWLEETARRWGIAVDFVDTTELDDIRRAIAPGRTRLVWIESPDNPMLGITDIAAAADIAHTADALLAVDGTVATPVLQQPLGLGADLVMHSATKGLNGHSDALAGALVTKVEDHVWDRIRSQRALGGAVCGTLEAWLLQRGMRTLFLRVQRACDNAQIIAEHLAGHPQVRRVFYPGLPRHPGHIVARGQMRGGFGPLVSMRVLGGADGARTVAGALKVFKRATSLGGVESLVEHRAPIEGPDTRTPDDLLRLSVGIEDVDDLLDDLSQALDRL